ncbi:MAG: T9SS type A sorting domain-containing protein [Bacteroidales bacterium]|nr:T9SS type A sorting domain-containing protein [Bacteroidales bacterium]
MKKFLLIHIAIFSLVLSANAQIKIDTVIGKKGYGLEYLLIEKNPVSEAAIAIDSKLTPNHIAYRIFADLEPDFQFLGCTGLDNTNPLTYMLIESSLPFYNDNVFGTASGQGANPALYSVFPNLEYDSYAADGRIGTGHVGVLKSVNALGYVPITPETTPPGDLSIPKPISLFTSNNSTKLYDYNSGWIVPGATPGPDAASNIVYIGQLTTAGELHLNFVITTQNPYGQIRYTKNVAYGYHPEPSIDIITPKSNAHLKINTPFDIEASVKDSDGTIDSVEIFAGYEKIKTFIMESNISSDTVKHNYSFSSLGTHIVKVIATDNEGNVSKDSITVTVSEIMPPAVSIIQPVNDSEITLDSTLMIIAEATDDGTVDSVEFFINDNKIGTVLSAPFQISWKADQSGNYNINARATDNETLSAFSTTISLIVNKPVSIKNEKQLKSDISIYPNPVQNSLRIEYTSLKSGVNCRISIYDITGNLLQSENFTSLSGKHIETIDVSALNKGVYILKYTGENKVDKYVHFIKTGN